MSKRKIALDSGLLVLLAVGSVSRESIVRHKRLKAYSPEDYDLLLDVIGSASRIVATPNAVTEASNIAGFGLRGELQTRIASQLKIIIETIEERYEPSRLVANEPEYSKLGISDCAWLRCLDRATPLLTADLDLYLAAAKRNLEALNFNHLREQRGTV